MSRFVLQMAGVPGSGKSTLARAIASETGAVVLDKDVIQSAALRAGTDERKAGPLAYEVLFDVADEIVASGHSLIVDSAAYFPVIIEKGTRIAKEHGLAYRVIECVCPSHDLQLRLASRDSRASQWSTLHDIDMEARPGASPLTLPHLTVDTSRPLDRYLPASLEYICNDEG